MEPMSDQEFQAGLQQGFKDWLAACNAGSVYEQILKIDADIGDLQAQINQLKQSQRALADTLPKDLTSHLGFSSRLSVSIMPHCYFLAKHKGISLEEAKTELINSFENISPFKNRKPE